MKEIIYHLIFIALGIYNIEAKQRNWFAQLFWGILGAALLIIHTVDLIRLFN